MPCSITSPICHETGAPNKRVQPTAPAVAFLKASDFEEWFPDLSIEFSQGRRLTHRALGRTQPERHTG